MRDRLLRLLRLHDATPAERQATFWTAALFFCVLGSYYLLRPLREQIGTAFDTGRLIGLFGLTFLIITLLNVPYMALANRLPAARLVPLVLHCFAASFVAFGVLFELVPPIRDRTLDWTSSEALVGAAFYSWITAFVPCGVTMVWVHAVHHFTTAQGKRLFGLVSVGGTLGAIFGSFIELENATASRQVMIVLTVLLLELSIWCYVRSRRACERMSAEHGVQPDPRRVTSGGAWRGFVLVRRSRYLTGIAGFVLLSSVVATVFYYQLTGLARARIPVSEDRVRLFSAINLVQNLIALAIQTTVTGRTLLRLGVALVLCLMPAVSLLGLSALALWPTIVVVAAVEVMRRTMQFAFDKPAREVLFTPLGLEAKYKSKAFIDTTVFRFGDLLGAGLGHLVRGLALPLLAASAAPLLALWAVLGLWLGRQCQRLKGAGRGGARTVAKNGSAAAATGSD